MDNFYFIGVDVSKKKLDFCVLFEGKVLREEQVSNHQQAVARLIGELKNDLEMDNEQFLICAYGAIYFPSGMCLQVGRVQTLVGEPVPDQIFIRYAAGQERQGGCKAHSHLRFTVRR